MTATAMVAAKVMVAAVRAVVSMAAAKAGGRLVAVRVVEEAPTAVVWVAVVVVAALVGTVAMVAVAEAVAVEPVRDRARSGWSAAHIEWRCDRAR